MKIRLTSEEKFILAIVCIVVALMGYVLDARSRVAAEEAVESAYEAGYASAMSDVVEMSTIIETWEVDGDEHILIKLPDGNIHEFVSPKALG